MSYSDTCAANPAKTPCPFSCTCQGHVKVYPNQDCKCHQPEPKNPWLQQTREILATAPEAERPTYADLVEDLSTYRMLAPNPDEGLKLDFAVEVLNRLANLEAKMPLGAELSLPKPFMLIDSSAFFQEYGSLIAHSTYATREEAVAECARVNAARTPGYKTYAVIQMMVIQHPTELPQED